jgi:hypothetical protein
MLVEKSVIDSKPTTVIVQYEDGTSFIFSGYVKLSQTRGVTRIRSIDTGEVIEQVPNEREYITIEIFRGVSSASMSELISDDFNDVDRRKP